MTRRLFIGWFVGMAGILMLLPNVAYSDIYLKQQQHTDAMTVMGQTTPAEDVVSEVWISPEKMSMSSSSQTIVIDLAKNSISIADHKAKTLMTMPLDFSGSEVASGMDKKEQAEFQAFMGKMMSVKVSVQPTSEKKKIGRWQCRKYNQRVEMGMGTITSEIWASSDIRVDPALYAKFNASLLAQIPGVSQHLDQAMNELQKIKGVHVLSKQTTEMMGQAFNSTNQLLDFKEGKAPKTAFQLPPSYTRQNVFK